MHPALRKQFFWSLGENTCSQLLTEEGSGPLSMKCFCGGCGVHLTNLELDISLNNDDLIASV